MPERRDRDDALAAAFERVADALRDGDADVYGYHVHTDPTAAETGLITYPGGRLEFRFEREEQEAREG